jgi:hypothetical protein
MSGRENTPFDLSTSSGQASSGQALAQDERVKGEMLKRVQHDKVPPHPSPSPTFKGEREINVRVLTRRKFCNVGKRKNFWMI